MSLYDRVYIHMILAVNFRTKYGPAYNKWKCYDNIYIHEYYLTKQQLALNTNQSINN
jgi:hypothetical protein